MLSFEEKANGCRLKIGGLMTERIANRLKFFLLIEIQLIVLKLYLNHERYICFLALRLGGDRINSGKQNDTNA